MPKHYPYNYYYGMPPPPPDPYEGFLKITKALRRQEEAKERKREEEERKNKKDHKPEFALNKKVFNTWQVFLLLTALGPIVGPITLAAWLGSLTLLKEVLLQNLK
jgi:hypothetical protein